MTVQSEFQRAPEASRLIKCLVIRFIVIVIRFIVIPVVKYKGHILIRNLLVNSGCLIVLDSIRH